METTASLVVASTTNAANAAATAVGAVQAINETVKTLANDESIGPQFGSRFDFTLLFEHAFFTAVPAGLLIAACPFYVYFRRNDKVQVKRGQLFHFKLATAFALFTIQIAQLALWTKAPDAVLRDHWAIATSSLSCFAAVCIVLLLNTEHRRSIRPSTILSVYFATSVIFDIVKARSYYLRNGLSTIGVTQVLITITKAGLLILEEIPKTSLLKDVNLSKTLGKEAISGFWTRALGVWMYETFATGFRNIISIDDLDNLGPGFSTALLRKSFEEAWKNRDHSKRFSLLLATFEVCRKHFLLAIIPRSLMSICSLSQPFLIHSAIGIIREENASRTDKIGLVLATVLVYGGKAILHSVYTSLLDRTSTRTRGVLTGKICAKAFRLPSKEAGKGASMTLSTTDIDAIVQGITYIHELWISFVEIGFIMYFLWIFAGYCCFLLFIPTILTVLWTAFFGPRVGAALQAWNAKIQERVGKTTQILAQAKQVKVLGLQSTLSDYIQQLRAIELRFQRSYMNHQSGIVVMAGTLFITNIPLPLDANRIFAILAVVQLSFAPLRYMVEAYARMSSLFSCFDRIAEFVKQQEQSDGRTHTLPIRLSVPAEVPVYVTDDSFLSRPIDLQGAAVGYEGSPAPILRQLDLLIPKGFLAIANGANGSGKTTFLNSLAGEGKIYNGQVYVAEGPVAFCEQTPWLRNGSIQDNILGYLPFNHQWYHTVLKSCCLDEDLQQMPKGDQTLAGNQGSKLSGGQRHRIALARAVYSRSPVLVLDDVFSALDNSTARRIFAGLFNQDGLLRQLGTTVVLATHRVEFFKAADLRLEFDNGSVAMKQGARCNIDNDVQLVPSQPQEPIDKEAIHLTAADEALDAINKQSSVYHKSDFSIYKFFFSTGSVSLFVLFAVLSAVTTAGERIPGIFMRYWLDQKPYDRTQFAGYAALSTSAVFGFLGMAAVFFHNLVPQYGQNMHRMLVDSMLGATIPYLTSADHGVLINRISQHMTLVTQQFARDFFKLTYSFLNVVADVAIIASASYYTAIFVPIILAILYLVQLVYLRTSRQLRGLDLEAKTPMYSLLAEVGTGASHMRAFNWEDAYLQRVHEVLDMSQKPFYAMACVQRWLTLIMDSINACVAVVLMCLAVFGGSATSQSGLGLAFVTLMGLSEAISFAMAQWIAIETSLGSIAGIRSFVAEAPVEKNSDSEASLPESWPQSGTIQFKDVTAFYGNAETSTAALKGISVTIAAKEKAAIKGRTGSGKSSLFLTLLSCLSYKGSIQIDGQELRDIPLDVLRTRIALCPQENLKLPGTIRQNLMPWLLNDPSKGSDDAELEKILKDLDLWDIVTAAGSLDAPMEDLDLSSGQSQLFSVARTMITKNYRGSRIILMDEVTSNLDPKTEDMIAKAIDAALSDCTVLTIAHRQRTITDADKVYEMENGSMKSTTDGESART